MRTADAELFKDKIEVSLDGRQIFYLFFGGAVMASLVFVLGVMVGKRLESRSHVAHSAQTSAALDPLAALDQLSADERADELSFPQTLTGGAALFEPPAPAPAKPAAVPVVKATPKHKPEPEPEPEVEAEPEPSAPVAASPAESKKADPAPAAADHKDANPSDEPLGDPKPAAQIVAKRAKAKFTLQLSSFQDRTEAEAFHAKLTAAGYQPYILEADVEGKGTWYRVRLGKYLSHEDAIAAKGEFEDKQHIIAYVTRL